MSWCMMMMMMMSEDAGRRLHHATFYNRGHRPNWRRPLQPIDCSSAVRNCIVLAALTADVCWKCRSFLFLAFNWFVLLTAQLDLCYSTKYHSVTAGFTVLQLKAFLSQTNINHCRLRDKEVSIQRTVWCNRLPPTFDSYTTYDAYLTR